MLLVFLANEIDVRGIAFDDERIMPGYTIVCNHPDVTQRVERGKSPGIAPFPDRGLSISASNP